MAAKKATKKSAKKTAAKKSSKTSGASAKKSAVKKSASKTPKSRRWSAKVTTDSTHPEEGLFNKSARTIARSLASKKVSPKGPASGMRMLNFYINRAGKNLPASRKAELKKAKTKLSEIIERQKQESAGEPS